MEGPSGIIAFYRLLLSKSAPVGFAFAGIERKSMNWHIGCSGFHYKEWKEFFYPKGLAQSKWFVHYSQQFDTVELNSTFYRFPRVRALENWYTKSPEHFLFSVKAPRLITHYKKFTDCIGLLDDFYGTIAEGLKEKLGPVLFQLPPSMPYSEEKLGLIMESMRTGFLNVVECRHSSWWNKKVLAVFRKNKTVFCSISYPGLPNEVIDTAGTIYYRFHGIPKLYYSAYEEKFLRKVINSIDRSKAKTAYVYFNNTAEEGAICNSGYIKIYITGKKKTKFVEADKAS